MLHTSGIKPTNCHRRMNKYTDQCIFKILIRDYRRGVSLRAAQQEQCRNSVHTSPPSGRSSNNTTTVWLNQTSTEWAGFILESNWLTAVLKELGSASRIWSRKIMEPECVSAEELYIFSALRRSYLWMSGLHWNTVLQINICSFTGLKWKLILILSLIYLPVAMVNCSIGAPVMTFYS